MPLRIKVESFWYIEVKNYLKYAQNLEKSI